MSEVSVNVEQEKQESWADKLKRWAGKKPSTTLQESNRFKRMGLLQYPATQDKELRLAFMMDCLNDIKTNLKQMGESKDDEDRMCLLGQNNATLFRTFMLIGMPYFAGLDNRTLTEKAKEFYHLEVRCGYLPSFYPDIKRCTELLLGLAWQKIHTIPQTPVLMETKMNVQMQGDRVNLGDATEGMQQY